MKRPELLHNLSTFDFLIFTEKTAKNWASLDVSIHICYTLYNIPIFRSQDGSSNLLQLSMCMVWFGIWFWFWLFLFKTWSDIISKLDFHSYWLLMRIWMNIQYSQVIVWLVFFGSIILVGTCLEPVEMTCSVLCLFQHSS